VTEAAVQRSPQLLRRAAALNLAACRGAFERAAFSTDDGHERVVRVDLDHVIVGGFESGEVAALALAWRALA